MSDTDSVPPKDPVLWLTQELGMIKFGFVAQALIGLVFREFGAKELLIKHNSHPDLMFWLWGERWSIEVEVMGLNKVDHIVKSEDLKHTKPRTAWNEPLKLDRIS